MSDNSNTKILDEFKSVYESKNYEQALNILHENKAQFEPGVYEYNIGLVYLKQGYYALARINFEKAKSLGFMSNELDAALSITKENLAVRQIEDSSSFSDKLNEVLFDTPSELFFSATVLLLIGFILTYRKLAVAPVRVLVLIIALFPSVFYTVVIDGKSKVITLEEHVVRRGPSKIFEEIQIVPKGMRVFINPKVDGWNYIVHPKSHEGWVKLKGVERI